MKALFHHSQNEKKTYGTNLKKSELHNAITLHPLKETKRMRKLYVYFLGLTAQELFEVSVNLQHEIQETTKLLFRSSNQENAKFVFENSSMLSRTPEKLSSFTFNIIWCRS